MIISRRTLLQLSGITGGLHLAGVRWSEAGEEGWQHGLSLFGDVKYPPDFKHFDYVNANAPKGGRVRTYGIGSFDSLNPYTFKGEPAGTILRTSDTLTASSLDEPNTAYGLVAEAVKHPADFSSVTYRLREAARFHDGRPMTPEDAIWSMEVLKKAHPFYAFYYKDVVKAEQTGEREVTFRFKTAGNRELPHITGQLPILPKHWWTSKDADGKDRNINETTLEVPLGSAAYRVTEVKPGRSITVARVEDYWGAELPVNVGYYNFDEITVFYFRDQTVALEAFKGDQYDWRNENSAKNWATAYDFPAVKKGSVIKEKIETRNGEGMQSYAFNTRRGKFKDPRVRRAFNFAFDFEWANENLFYGQYKRTRSFFSNTELAAEGLPMGQELEILSEFKTELPLEVFVEEFTNPESPTPRERRNNLREAAKLLKQAGWKAGSDRLLRNANNEAFEVEFLLNSPLFERIILPYVKQLQLLGIRSKIRTVDSAQYQRRTQTFDFDIVVGSWGQSLSPGNEQRDFWGSEAADRQGSRNLVGIKNPVIDKLIDKVIFAKDRQELISATRALDRTLLWHHYVVPMWHIPYARTVRWNRFSRPEKLPDYSIGFPSIWWWDEEKAAKVKADK